MIRIVYQLHQFIHFCWTDRRLGWLISSQTLAFNILKLILASDSIGIAIHIGIPPQNLPRYSRNPRPMEIILKKLIKCFHRCGIRPISIYMICYLSLIALMLVLKLWQETSMTRFVYLSLCLFVGLWNKWRFKTLIIKVYKKAV